MKFILIMTLIVKIGSGTGGGVATAEFDSEFACKAAGTQWEAEIVQEYYTVNNSFYLCVKKE